MFDAFNLLYHSSISLKTKQQIFMPYSLFSFLSNTITGNSRQYLPTTYVYIYNTLLVIDIFFIIIFFSFYESYFIIRLYKKKQKRHNVNETIVLSERQILALKVLT